jgi:hypothetical protein
MAQQIQLRNDTTAGWAYANPVLTQAEIGVDTTLGKFKIGDGTSTWSQLQFQSASIADFVFTYDGEGSESLMTVTDHDMTIRTLRVNDSPNSDCDINIEAADDVFINANGDDVSITAKDEVRITSNSYAASHQWTFDSRGHVEFPDGTIQTTSAQGIRPLPDFLNWRQGTTHLPTLNTNFGWNSDGVWFINAGEGTGTSYPIFTDFTIAQNEPVIVTFDFDANTECNDIGVCVYSDEANPEWAWTPNLTRIAAQFDCFDLELIGRTTEVTAQNAGIPNTGLYTVTFTYNPTAPTDKVTVSYKAQGSNTVLASITLNEALPAGPYRVGFAADQNSSSTKTYMSNLSIDVNNDTSYYSSDLKNGNSGITSDVDLVVPTAIKDGDGDDFITFTRTGTGTARIATPQDDLSLRSARDITLIAGDNGPGNVYIGWGDATISPNASNRVATIGDIPNAELVSTANNSASYGIYYAAGFTEVTTEGQSTTTDEVGSAADYYNTGQIEVFVSMSTGTDTLLTSLYNGSVHAREITITNNNIGYLLTNPVRLSDDGTLARWRFNCSQTLSIANNSGYGLTIVHAGAPIIWWSADIVNPSGVGSFSTSNFRGAKIEYHAYVSDSGTVIGTIYIADDSDDENVTHIETASGGNDTGTATFWNRSGNERELHLYRTDGESVLHKIQWTAQMYYATEAYED